MILEETIFIACEPARAVDFFENLDRHYRDWHPDHRAFAWTGPAADRRRRCFFDEVIGGRRLRTSLRVRRLDQHKVLCVPVNPFWQIVLLGMTFVITPEAGGCRYTHQIGLRLGPFERWARRHWIAPIERHMAEEGHNLKRLLENAAGGNPAGGSLLAEGSATEPPIV